MSIYRQVGKPDVTNERMTHLLKLDTIFRTHDARIMTYGALRIRTTHRVDPALDLIICEKMWIWVFFFGIFDIISIF